MWQAPPAKKKKEDNPKTPTKESVSSFETPVQPPRVNEPMSEKEAAWNAAVNEARKVTAKKQNDMPDAEATAKVMCKWVFVDMYMYAYALYVYLNRQRRSVQRQT